MPNFFSLHDYVLSYVFAFKNKSFVKNDLKLENIREALLQLASTYTSKLHKLWLFTAGSKLWFHETKIY